MRLQDQPMRTIVTMYTIWDALESGQSKASKRVDNKRLSIIGNVQFNWPKLFQAFSIKFTLILFHECVHSIIPHQHM